MSATIPNIVRAQRKARRTTTAAATLQVGRVHIHTGAAADLTLPLTAEVGDMITIINAGSGVTTIKQNAGQAIRHISSDTTTGTGGSLAAGSVRDQITLVCTTKDTTFTTVNNKGTWTVA